MNAITLLLTPFAIIGAIYVYNLWAIDRTWNNLPEAKPFQEPVIKVSKVKAHRVNKMWRKRMVKQMINNQKADFSQWDTSKMPTITIIELNEEQK